MSSNDHENDNNDSSASDTVVSSESDLEFATESPLSKKRLITLVAGPVLTLVLLLLPAPAGMSEEAWRMVAFATWMVVWWLGEAVPIPATALLPIPMLPLLGIGDMRAVASSYAHPLIYLFLGGFLLAAAMQRWGLHRRIALGIIDKVGTSPGSIIGGFMVATAFLSMWISNTATTIMMFAVGISVIGFIADRTKDRSVVRNFGVALMLGIAYSASIGGVGTLIGTPPNALLASFLSDTYATEIGFFTWMTFGIPVVVILLPCTWLMLTKVVFPTGRLNIGDAGNIIREEMAALGSISRGEKIVAIVFSAAAAGWILRTQIASITGLAINDTSIALIAALVLFATPVSLKKGQFVLDWEAARDLPWGVLILFGGGLALAGAFKSTGLAEWIGMQVGGVEVGTWTLIAIVLIAIVYLTEITSNTATTATFLPILGAVAVGLEIAPEYLVIPVALAASMAFMMPVATPPNAIVFSYQDMQLADMVKAGFWLNILAIVVSYAAMYFLAPAIFGLGV